MSIAIVGAAGYVGQALTRFFTKQGRSIQPIDCVPWHDENDLSPITVHDILSDIPPLADGTQAVIYLAQSPYYRDFPDHADHLFGVNVLGALRAAQAAIRCGCRVFCYASTGNVYQPSFKPLSENVPLRRDDPYALSKLMAEEALALFGDAMQTLVLRLFGVFGPGQTNMLPATLRRRILNGKAIALHPAEAGQQDEGLRISFFYIDDVVRGIADVVDRAIAGHDVPAILNMAGPEPVSLKRFAEGLAANMGRTPVFEAGGTPRNCDLVADIQRWTSFASPQFTPLDDALARTAED